MSLGENIYHLRTKKGMSQGDLAEALEVSRQSVSKWETGGATPDLDKLVKLSQLFGISLDELVKGEEPPPAPVQAAEPEPRVIYVERAEPAVPRRKIVGYILFGLATLIVLLCTILGGMLGGVLFSLPFWACGAVCFLFKERVGLWCSWTVFFLVDIFLKYATGYSSGGLRSILRLVLLGHGNVLPRTGILASAVMTLILVALVVLTIRSFCSKILPSSKAVRRSLILQFVILLLCEAIPWGISLFVSTLPTESWFIYWRCQTFLYAIFHWLRITLFQRLVIDLLAIRRWKKAHHAE